MAGYGTNYPGSYSDSHRGSSSSSSSSSLNYGSSKLQLGTAKMEEDLSITVKKALSPDEAAPKQKHVRACILYTWDIKGSGSLWRAMQSFPMLGDEVIIFKALVTTHKIINQGHPGALRDIANNNLWLKNLSRNVGSFRGYGGLIQTYLQFLLAKLEYHRQHTQFSGNFDYEEYVTLKGVEDPNEGYETISDLLGLMKKVDSMANYVFDNVRPGGANECKISALVPLVEESYGIYQFCVSMLMAMHQTVGSVEVLAPLREKFNQSHYQLYKFYYECSGIKYLTSLITIPKLEKSPPDFLSRGAPRVQPKRPITPPPSKSEDDLIAKQQAELEAQIRAENERLEQQRREAELQQQQQRQKDQERLRQQQQQQLEAQRQAEQQRLLELQQQQALYEQQRRAEEERLRQLQMQQQQAMESQQYAAMIENMKGQSARDRETIEIYDKRVKLLENQLANMSMNSNEGLIKSLQDELAQWKQKYEALAKLYAQLRKEHLDLLNKFKEIKEGSGKQADEVRKDLEKAREELKAKSNQLTDLLIERDRLKNEADRIRSSTEEELIRLRRDLKDTKDSLIDMSKTKGSEVSSIVSKHNLEMSELERVNQSHQQTIGDLRRRVDQLTGEVQRLRLSKDEESSVLQSGLDQTLLALAQLQKSQQDTEASLLSQIEKIRAEHLLQLNRMMDNILQTCITKVDGAVLDLDDETNEGNVTASPEYVQTLLEKTVGQAGDFAASFIKMLEGGDQADAITTSNAFAVGLEQLLQNTKGVLRLAPDEGAIDEILRAAKACGANGRNLFDRLKSSALTGIDRTRLAEHINVLTRDAIMGLLNMSPLVEKLAPKATFEAVGGDLGDLVEREMQAAAKAIEDAARRLQELMAAPSTNLDVHQAVLASAIALTNAIAQLIRCATVSQQEIAVHGRGTTGGSTAAFYKKNNKWTEGLVSAAKAVAEATTFLVECADGLIKGTHSMEQLIVAAQEVGVSTTQLVAASRVKAVPFSKAQNKLEDAAVAVREATKLLVKAARDAAKLNAEKSAREEIGRLSRHEIKIKEIQQQVKILELEKELNQARYKLGEIRKQSYAE